MQLKGKLLKQHNLARYTSWRTGGAADECFFPADLQDLQAYLKQQQHQNLLWLGLGSNTLIRDGGFKGAAIVTLKGLTQINLTEDARVFAQAGVTCAKLAKLGAKNGFNDAAFFAGIPGTVGGALAMNAGAYDNETWQFVESIRTIDNEGVIRERSPKDFSIAYRHVTSPANEYFLAATFRFKMGDAEHAQAQIKSLLKSRNDSQPIGQFSCGSVFRNPPGDYAARLIEACDLKGYRIGGASVSSKHANFIINDGSASAMDIEQLIAHLAQTVKQRFAVALVRECHIVGEAIDEQKTQS